MSVKMNDKISLQHSRTKLELVRIQSGVWFKEQKCYVFFLLGQHSFEVVQGFRDTLLIFFKVY